MADFLLTVPSFIKVGVVFCLILIVNKAGLSLGLSIICCSIALTLWAGAGVSGVAQQFLDLKNPDNYLLFLTVVCLLFFSEILEKSGRMKKTVTAIKEWLPNDTLLYAGLPALVGLLPMPGGALFSAPMVASIDTRNMLPPAHKAAINYWFRHIWECWWPLYPGVVLAISYSGLTPGLFYATMIPFSMAALAGGYLFLLRPISGSTGSPNQKRSFHFSNIAASAVPLGILVSISIVGSLTFSAWLHISQNRANLAAVLLGIMTAIIMVVWRDRGIFTDSVRILMHKKNTRLFSVVIGVLLFSTALKLQVHTGEPATLVSLMRDEFQTYGIPILLILALLPFISGAVTGLALGFVGVSFPLCFQLIGPHPSLQQQLATTAFCYGFGYIGMLLSPIHLCFVVTSEYFKSKILHAYPYIAGPVGILFAWIFGISALYYFW